MVDDKSAEAKCKKRLVCSREEAHGIGGQFIHLDPRARIVAVPNAGRNWVGVVEAFRDSNNVLASRIGVYDLFLAGIGYSARCGAAALAGVEFSVWSKTTYRDSSGLLGKKRASCI